ncbi:MAG: hypothetical protein H8E60_06880 [Candidatus Marinimicrobia bacterium]|nr:hypothetical protein [Candidatus Neomarinimicrobiota bacterium]
MEKYFRYLGFSIFIIFAGLQYNDPDPLKWIIIYGSCALYSFNGIKIRSLTIFHIKKEFFFIASIYSSFICYILLKEVSYFAIKTEHIFEISGLFICIAWLYYLKRLN